MPEMCAMYPGSFSSLTNGNVHIIVRGVRSSEDLHSEFEPALMNRNLAPDIETFFMMPNVNYSFLSSNLVREVAALGGSVEGLVPGPVARKLREKIRRSKKVQSS